MQLKIKKLCKDAVIPCFIQDGDAALDLYSSESISLPSQGHALIPTGIAMAIPKGYAGLIWDRSGLAAKNKLKTMGGVIDSNYRGEIKIIVYNLSTEDFNIEAGMRIAQMLIQKVEQPITLEVEELEETNRGNQGFGSTGLK